MNRSPSTATTSTPPGRTGRIRHGPAEPAQLENPPKPENGWAGERSPLSLNRASGPHLPFSKTTDLTDDWGDLNACNWVYFEWSDFPIQEFLRNSAKQVAKIEVHLSLTRPNSRLSPPSKPL